MKRPTPQRLAIIAGWLLTPFIAWAVSLLGGWLGALIGYRVSSGLASSLWLVGGSLLGAVVAVVGWILVLGKLQRSYLNGDSNHEPKTEHEPGTDRFTR